MKKKKWMYLLTTCLTIGSIVTSCSEELDISDLEQNRAKAKFTLSVSSEQMNGQTRLGLNEDETTMYWAYGDKLVLVNTSSNDSIPMYAELEEGDTVTSCVFSTTEGVPAGSYYVLANGNSKTLKASNYRLFTASEINNRKLVKLYSMLDVAEGQTNAGIILRNVYAKMRINLINADELASNSNSAYIGMMNAHGKIITEKKNH